jgi:hypothetical protein
MEEILDGEGTFGGRGPVAGAQIPLETGQDVEHLEARLQQRAMALVGSDESESSASSNGTGLTRLT